MHYIFVSVQQDTKCLKVGSPAPKHNSTKTIMLNKTHHFRQLKFLDKQKKYKIIFSASVRNFHLSTKQSLIVSDNDQT